MVLKELSELNGTSGHEEKVRKFLKDNLEKLVDEVIVDSIGNLILLKKGVSNSKRIMFAAHMDEVALMVTKIEKNGFIKFATVGGIEPSVLPAQTVVIESSENIFGVIGVRPIHVQRSEEFDTPIKKENLYIDISANSSDELAGKIELGDPIYFNTKYGEFGKLVKGKAFDDRVGCAVLYELISKNFVPDYDTYFVFTTQEEVGIRGSRISAFRIEPDLAFVFEGTSAGDIPLLERNRWSTQINKGPVITYMQQGLVIQKKVISFIESVAKENNIPYQFREKTSGATDATSIARSGVGVPTGVISIPTRYIHSPVSVLSLNDCENTVLLSEAILSKIKSYFEINIQGDS